MLSNTSVLRRGFCVSGLLFTVVVVAVVVVVVVVVCDVRKRRLFC